MDHALRMLMLEQTQKAGEKSLSQAEVGDLAMFHGRLVEVVGVEEVGGYNRARTVEFTDGGGIVRTLEVQLNPWSYNNPFHVIRQPKDQVLDTIAALTTNGTALCQLELRTERWMARPWVGDLYHSGFSFYMQVTAISPQIKTRETTKFCSELGWLWDDAVYVTADAFREQFQQPNMPGYGVQGLKSRRTEELQLIPWV